MTHELQSILARHQFAPTHLLQVLREVQDHYSWIAPEALDYVAAGLGLPRARVEGVAGFYSFLHSDAPCRYRLLFSDNITDRMLGNQELIDYLCEKLWVERGHISEDGLVSVSTTSCTGLCDQGPALLVNGWAIPRLTRERLDQIAELVLAQTPVETWPRELFAVEDNIHRADLLLDNTLQAGDALRASISRGGQVESAANARSWREGIPAAEQGPLATLEEIKRSNLRGRGGAGFTTGLKWEACRNAQGEKRYVVCNADEGEPGTFKDRVLLTAQADLMFEGMTVCAYAIGAGKGFLYLRGEYRYLLEPLNAVLARRRAANLLGKDILAQAGFDFDIEIHLGAGAYVCGEESALIESLEGKRGIPRNRPPYPVTHGYLQRPTTVNNVETFCAAALVAAHGGDWYRGIGTAKSAGSKVLSVSGDCARPGIYEYPFGVTVRQVLADCGAGSGKSDTLAVQISGPSGVCIAADEFDRRIAFEDLATAGAFTVFDSSRDMFEVARNFAHFFAHESCGFCTPCRVGTAMLRTTMDKIADGHGTLYDLAEIEKLDRVLNQSAHCGLGHTACNPTLDTMKRFRPTYERRLKSHDFEPAFDLDGALAAARRMTGRDDAGAHLSTEGA
ncbi:MAG: NAD(P)H-dependent oxidoreductase subunit E [Pseudomonadota bacterium]|nr:NAD(P)H-dependent oxidoreductase subunit E [Pseudomonadota bacterium]